MKERKKTDVRGPRSHAEGRAASTRSVVQQAVKAASHPVRNQILKSLKAEPSSAMELEEATGRSRYDLYHHLSVLEESGLVEHRFRDGKTKEFYLIQPRRPENIVMLFDHEDLKAKPKALKKLLEAAEELEGCAIPHKGKITGVQIVFSLPWASHE